jgi:hypothetical protein
MDINAAIQAGDTRVQCLTNQRDLLRKLLSTFVLRLTTQYGRTTPGWQWAVIKWTDSCETCTVILKGIVLPIRTDAPVRVQQVVMRLQYVPQPPSCGDCTGSEQ